MSIANVAGNLAQGQGIEVRNGQIRERTIEFGDNIIIVDNIGSMQIDPGILDPTPVQIGVVGVAAGLAAYVYAPPALQQPGLIACAIGVLFLVYSMMRKRKHYLSIGTCDGRRLSLVSTDRKALEGTLDFIRRKIDTHSTAGATIINGGIAIGANAQASGSNGDFHNGGAR